MKARIPAGGAIRGERLFSSNDNASLAMSRLERALREMGFETHPRDDTLIAEKGSKLAARLFGAFFISPQRLPIRIEIEVTVRPPGTAMRTTLSDNWGWGLRAGLDEVYRPYFRSVFEELSKKTAFSEKVSAEEIERADQKPVALGRSRRKRWRVILVFAALVACALLAIDFLEVLGRFLVEFLSRLN